jgi:hypothetical protein
MILFPCAVVLSECRPLGMRLLGLSIQCMMSVGMKALTLFEWVFSPQLDQWLEFLQELCNREVANMLRCCLVPLAASVVLPCPCRSHTWSPQMEDGLLPHKVPKTASDSAWQPGERAKHQVTHEWCNLGF